MGINLEFFSPVGVPVTFVVISGTERVILVQELPEQEIYCPPVTIVVVDCRSFGRVALVGTHIISNVHSYMWTPAEVQETKPHIEDIVAGEA